MYQIYALKYAERDTPACGFFYREHSHETITLHYFVWLILGGPHPVLLDTGFQEDDVERRGIRNYVRPSLLVERMGVKVADIPIALISHLHYDHWRATASSRRRSSGSRRTRWPSGPDASAGTTRLASRRTSAPSPTSSRSPTPSASASSRARSRCCPASASTASGATRRGCRSSPWRRRAGAWCSPPTPRTSTATSSATSRRRSSRTCPRCWQASTPSTRWPATPRAW